MAAENIYTPLDPSQEEIRLLEITSLTPQITCKLHTVALKDQPTFSALSYLWGDPKGTEPVTVNGIQKSMTRSLRSALEWTQHHWQAAFPERDLASCRLWADALCINQDDPQEKSHQIPLMGKIYSVAERTFCCLDAWAPEAETNLILDLFNALARGAAESGFDPEREDHQEVDIDWVNTHPLILQHCAPFEEQSKPTVVRALDAFDDLDYWTRVWILQELVLSKQALLVFHTRSMELSDLMLLGKWGRIAGKLARPENVDRSIWTRFQYLFTTGSIALVQQGRDLINTQPGGWERRRTMMVLQCANLAATDPKDHIYGLLGVAGLPITPDYSPTKSLASVYIEFCVECLRSGMVNILMGFQHPEVFIYHSALLPLRFLDHAGIAGQDNDHGLPSWAPNFPAISEDSPAFEVPRLSKNLPADEDSYGTVLVGRDWIDKILIYSNKLAVPAVVVTSLVDIGPILTDTKDDGREFVSFILDNLGRLPIGRQHRHPLLILADAFYTDEIRAEVWKSSEALHMIKLMQHLLARALYQHIETEDDVAALRAEHEVIYGREFMERIGIGAAWISDVLPPPPEGLSASEARRAKRHDREVVSFLEDVWEDSYAGAADGEFFDELMTSTSRLFEHKVRAARTASDDFGIIPSHTAVGDCVVLLLGYEGLSLVRRVDDHYIYVGPCRISTSVQSILRSVQAGEMSFEMLELQ